MRMSTRGRYGLRIMIELARRYGEGLVTVDNISKGLEISANYIHLLAAGLKSAGLVRSMRGAGGGYELSREPASITALEVVGSVEGSSPVECATRPESCSRSMFCAAGEVWSEVCLSIDAALAGHTLEDLAVRQQVLEAGAPAGAVVERN